MRTTRRLQGEHSLGLFVREGLSDDHGAAVLALTEADDDSRTAVRRDDDTDELGVLEFHGEPMIGLRLGEHLVKQRDVVSIERLVHAPSRRDWDHLNQASILRVVDGVVVPRTVVAVNPDPLPTLPHLDRNEDQAVAVDAGAGLLDALEGADELLVHGELHPLVEADDAPKVVVVVGDVPIVERDDDLLVVVVLVDGPEEVHIVVGLVDRRDRERVFGNATERPTGVGHHHGYIAKHRLTGIDVTERIVDVIEVLEVGVDRYELAANDTEQTHGHLQGIDTPAMADVAPRFLEQSRSLGGQERYKLPQYEPFCLCHIPIGTTYKTLLAMWRFRSLPLTFYLERQYPRSAKQNIDQLVDVLWSHSRGSNPRPHPYHGCALPSELLRRIRKARCRAFLMVGWEGFEPSKAQAKRFTVSPR